MSLRRRLLGEKLTFALVLGQPVWEKPKPDTYKAGIVVPVKLAKELSKAIQLLQG